MTEQDQDRPLTKEEKEIEPAPRVSARDYIGICPVQPVVRESFGDLQHLKPLRVDELPPK